MTHDHWLWHLLWLVIAAGLLLFGFAIARYIFSDFDEFDDFEE